MTESETITPAKLLTRKPVLVFTLGTVLAIAVAIAVSIGTAKPQTFDIKGSLSFNCYPCGLSGHDDISVGVTTLKLVKLDDPDLALLELYNRTFTFTFTGDERYGFHAGDNTRGTIWKTEAEAAKDVDLVVK